MWLAAAYRAESPVLIESALQRQWAAVSNTHITDEYRRLVRELGFVNDPEAASEAGGMISGEALRRSPSQPGSGALLDKHFRYASILPDEKLGVTHVFEINGAPCLYFKSLSAEPTEQQLRDWHRTAWNHGLGRMLWVVTPRHVRVLNAFMPPEKSTGKETRRHPAELLQAATADLEQLRKFELDRISLESGQFWTTKAGKRITKKTRIDEQLADDLEKAGELLAEKGCDALKSHRLMLRTLFTAYLEARGVLPANLFEGLKASSLGDVLQSSRETKTFFERMCETFNGDLFPPPPKSGAEQESYTFTNEQLSVARSIVMRRDLTSGQQTFDFARYDFEVIPIELISSIYERFIYAGDPELAKKRGTHYTPVNLVDLVFSQVFDDSLFDAPLGEKPKVLDLACGSGVFLVEAFRRLLSRRVAAGERWNRTLVRDVLAKQLYGVDLEETAIEIAAFSLCLTAFELDPSPGSITQLKFRESLKGRNLFVGDAFGTNGFTKRTEFANSDFTIVVGNPPWKKTTGSKTSKETASQSHIAFCASHEPLINLPYRSPIDQAFIWRSRYFAKPGGRIALIVDAKNFFSQEDQSLVARKQLFESMRARVMLNLSALHDKKLFPSSKQPAMIIVAEHRTPSRKDEVVFASAERNETFAKHGIVELFLERANPLPIRRVATERFILKTASHGTPRDYAIICSLHDRCGTLEAYVHNFDSDLYQGFIRGDGSRPVPQGVQKLPMLEDTPLHRWKQSTGDLPKMKHKKLERPRTPAVYEGPLCLIQQSLQEDRLVSALCYESVAYSRTYFGIPLGDSANWVGQSLTAYFNSALATYCFFLTATRFGIDKQIVERTDLARLPYRNDVTEATCQRLTHEFAQGVRHPNRSLASLDHAVFDFFDLSQWEREYVTDVVKYDLDFVRHGSSSTAAKPPTDEDLTTYASTLVDSIRSNLSDSSLKVNADVITGVGDVCAVVVRFDEHRQRAIKSVDVANFDFSGRLAELLHAPLTSAFQLRRSLVMFDNDRCIIVKHAQKRFWSRARAYDDADAIFAELARP